MNKRILLAPALAASALSLSACAENYALEGAGLGAAAGAAAAAITGEDFETYAVAGAAIGGIAGYFKDKNNRCDGFYDRRGRYLDDDCRGDRRYGRYFR
ncbi:glycine zipper domain-containing protein [Qipengyuania sp. JC766]|uniref:glycine zipper domain-containing protein n=1 Tax=Qipengyuania sp. JC766 TaxID=3232139 RepID=UPI0034589202